MFRDSEYENDLIIAVTESETDNKKVDHLLTRYKRADIGKFFVLAAAHNRVIAMKQILIFRPLLDYASICAAFDAAANGGAVEALKLMIGHYNLPQLLKVTSRQIYNSIFNLLDETLNILCDKFYPESELPDILSKGLIQLAKDEAFERTLFMLPKDDDKYLLVVSEYQKDVMRVARTLIQRGANITTRDENGTAIDYAKKSKFLGPLVLFLEAELNQNKQLPASCSASSGMNLFSQPNPIMPAVSSNTSYEIKIHEDYSAPMKKYLRALNGKEMNRVRISDDMRKLDAVDKYEDLCSNLSSTFPNIPVELDERLYCLEELEAILLEAKKNGKKAIVPHSNDATDTFNRSDIAPARKAQDKINEMIQAAKKGIGLKF